MVQPVYPYALLHDDRRGKATAVFVVGPAGEVSEIKIVEATAPECGLALAAAIETFKFTPAFKDGHPGQATLKTEQAFDTHDASGLVTDDDLALLRREKKKPESIVGADKLDAPLKPLSRRPQSSRWP